MKAPAPKGSYFSIRQFTQDQFHTFGAQPFTIEKKVTLNGKTDSSLVSVLALDWPSILKTFFQSDISDPKFLGQYNFSVFDDDATTSRTYYYEAKTDGLFTRSLQIVTDPFTDKVKSIYIETAKNGRFSQKTQKLFYIPIKTIQIQEFESSFMSEDKNLRIEYRFLY